MRLIFAGTPDFAVPPLKALIAEHDVVAVFTQPDRRAGRGKKLVASPVKQLALEHAIEVVQPDSLNNAHSLIAELNADAMVVVAYGMLLPADILALPRLGCINIHASLLPRWRGAAPIQRAIEAGDTQTGVAIMQMDIGLDTGPVYQMLTTPIEQHDTNITLHQKLSELGAQGIIDTLQALDNNPDLEPTPQAHEQASYAHKISKAEVEINWQQSASQLDCRIRAFLPWPVCQTHYQAQRVRVWQASVVNAEDSERALKTYGKVLPEPGTIVSTEPTLMVSCGSGALNLHTVQRDGGKQMSSREFCNGYGLAVGDKMGVKPHG